MYFILYWCLRKTALENWACWNLRSSGLKSKCSWCVFIVVWFYRLSTAVMPNNGCTVYNAETLWFISCQDIFCKNDKDQSGTMSSMELRGALEKAGKISPPKIKLSLKQKVCSFCHVMVKVKLYIILVHLFSIFLTCLNVFVFYIQVSL